MKNILIFISLVLTITSCCKKEHCDDLVSESMTNDLFVYGKVSVENTKQQLGVIVISNNHDDSYKVLFDEKSFDVKIGVKINDSISFKVNKVNGVPFASSITKNTDFGKSQLYSKPLKTSLAVHAELEHDFADDAHTRTHIYKRTKPSGEIKYYADRSDNAIYDPNKNIAGMDEVLIPETYKNKVDSDSIKIFFAEWSNPVIVNGVFVTILDDIDKCHFHGVTREVCID